MNTPWFLHAQHDQFLNIFIMIINIIGRRKKSRNTAGEMQLFCPPLSSIHLRVMCRFVLFPLPLFRCFSSGYFTWYFVLIHFELNGWDIIFPKFFGVVCPWCPKFSVKLSLLQLFLFFLFHCSIFSPIFRKISFGKVQIAIFCSVCYMTGKGT